MNKNNIEFLDPTEVIEELSKEKTGLIRVFNKEYKSYIRSLQNQAFIPNGYRLVVIKDDNKDNNEEINK